SKLLSRRQSRPPVPGCILVWSPRSSSYFHLNGETHFHKSSVVKSSPIFHCRIVLKQFVKLFPRLHLVEPTALRARFFQRAQKFFARFDRNSKRALGKNHHPVSKICELPKRQ